MTSPVSALFPLTPSFPFPVPSPSRKRIVLLGATGSIGESTLRVIAAHRDRLELVGIAAQRNHGRLAEIARQFGVPHVGLYDPTALAAARDNAAFPPGTQFHGGIEGLCELAALIAVTLALTTIVSDLIESVIKRRADTKDTGALIPGIGGAFDLIDSLILTAPVAYFIFQFLE